MAVWGWTREAPHFQTAVSIERTSAENRNFLSDRPFYLRSMLRPSPLPLHDSATCPSARPPVRPAAAGDGCLCPERTERRASRRSPAGGGFPREKRAVRPNLVHRRHPAGQRSGHAGFRTLPALGQNPRPRGLVRGGGRPALQTRRQRPDGGTRGNRRTAETRHHQQGTRGQADANQGHQQTGVRYYHHRTQYPPGPEKHQRGPARENRNPGPLRRPGGRAAGQRRCLLVARHPADHPTGCLADQGGFPVAGTLFGRGENRPEIHLHRRR